jgi:hypothetical protein
LNKWNELSFKEKEVEIQRLVTEAYHCRDYRNSCDRIENAIEEFLWSMGIREYNVRVTKEDPTFIDGDGYPDVVFMVEVVPLKDEDMKDVFDFVRPVYG